MPTLRNRRRLPWSASQLRTRDKLPRGPETGVLPLTPPPVPPQSTQGLGRLRNDLERGPADVVCEAPAAIRPSGSVRGRTTVGEPLHHF